MNPGRKPGTTSPAIRRASRRAGKLGGRPRDKLPADVVSRLGAPPADPAAMRVWNARVLAEIQWLSLQGKIGTDLAGTIRANATAIDRAMPRRAPEDDDRPPPVSDEIDDDDSGPELDDIADADGVRVG